MNLQKQFTDTRKALVDSVRVIRVMEDQLKAADALAKAVKSVADGLENHIADEQRAPYAFYKELTEALAAYETVRGSNDLREA